MPRFTDRPLAPPPVGPTAPDLTITLGGVPLGRASGDLIQMLAPRDVEADFHCVTTWRVRGLVWRGVPLRGVLSALGTTHPPAPYAVARGADRRSTVFVWEDLTAPEVLLATHLDGRPLDARHGAPLRLVSPHQYGYKNVKHLVRLDFRDEAPPRPGKHLRARVAVEERHPRIAGRVLRLPYRVLVPPTALLAERSLRL